jgi:antitoxin HicB
MKKRNKHVGSSLDDFLKEDGVLEETRAVALKETLAWEVQQAMEKDKISKVEMARRMNTSRAALDRLLDPGNASVTLQTLSRAAHAIGRNLRIELVKKLTSPRDGKATVQRTIPQVLRRPDRDSLN